MENSATIGRTIRRTRMAKDYNIKAFATKVGLSGFELYDIELGKKQPTEEQLALIARELNINLAKLS